MSRPVAGHPSVIDNISLVSLPCVSAGRAAAVSDDLETARESNQFRTDPDRFVALDLLGPSPSTPLLRSASARSDLSAVFVL